MAYEFSTMWNVKNTLVLMAVVVIVFVFKERIVDLIKQFMNGLLKRFFAISMVVFTWNYNKVMGSNKKELFSTLEEHLNHVGGDIVEIGAGTGANFQFYPKDCSFIAVDPNEHMHRFLLRSKKGYPNIILKDCIVCPAEDMAQFQDNSVSVVVATLVLCSVESMEQVLKEVIRILKPGGRFYFLEHVGGKGLMLKWQKFHDIWWRYVADGCRLTRRTEDIIRKAGFDNVECRRFDANISYPPIRPHIMGFAEIKV